MSLIMMKIVRDKYQKEVLGNDSRSSSNYDNDEPSRDDNDNDQYWEQMEQQKQQEKQQG